MTPELLKRVGEALYGDRWVADLARALDISDRHVRRMHAGTAPVADGVKDDMIKLIEDRLSALTRLLGDVYKATPAAPGVHSAPKKSAVCEECAGSGWVGHGMGGDTCGRCGGTGRA